MMRTKAHFTGISNPNSQSILFLSNSCGMLLPGPWRKPPASWNLRFSRFSGEFHSSCLQYSHLIRTCQEPGRNIFGGFLPTSREAFPGRPVRRSPHAKNRAKRWFSLGSLGVSHSSCCWDPGLTFPKTADFCDLWQGSLGVWRCLQDPGNLKLQQKTPENGNFSLGSLGVLALDNARRAPGDLGSYPQVIHRLLTLGEFGSFTQIPPKA